MDRTKEIRRALMGRIITENGVNQVAPNGQHVFYSTVNGSGYATLFGVSKQTRLYTVPEHSNPKTDAQNLVKSLGRVLKLEMTPDTQASFRRNTWSNMKVYTATVNGKTLDLTVFTARTLFSQLFLFLALRKMESRLPVKYIRKDLPKKEKIKKTVKEKIQEKRQEKRNKKNKEEAE